MFEKLVTSSLVFGFSKVVINSINEELEEMKNKNVTKR